MPPKCSKTATRSVYKSAGSTSKSSGTHGEKVGVKKTLKKAPTGTKKTKKMKKKNIPTRQRILGIVENFIVVWLDAYISLSNKDCQNSITQLRRIVNSIQTFTEIHDCSVFLNQIKDENIFLIVSGALGKQIVPFVEHLPHLDSIYVFCSDKAKHQLWAGQHGKVKDVYTDIGALCDVLKYDVRQRDNDLVSISILSKTDDFTRDRNTLDSSFMYSKLLKEILIDIEHDQQARTNLVDFCLQQYGDNPKELKIIDEFNKTYSPASAIWWYTRECFTYTMLNKALRTQDVEIIIKMGFFLRDLHQQINKLHIQTKHQGLLTVYRGQVMMNSEFEKLTKCQGGLLSFNHFLSTSTNRQVALQFARRSQKRNSDVTPIFFQIEINPLVSSTPFTSVNGYSCLTAENEILFSMHTVFRIGEIQQMKEGIWKVSLQLTNDNDKQLQSLTDHLREETSGSNGWHRLGSLMIAMGQFDEAEKFYTLALEITPDDNWKERAHLHHQLGRIYDEKSDQENALGHYEEALDIQLENLPSGHPSLSMTYTGIGSVLHSQQDFDEALEHFQYALNIARLSSHPDLLKIATIHNYIGQVFDEQEKYAEALNSYQEALSIRQGNLPPLHPLLATTYNNIGLLHQSMNDYSKALVYLEKTLDIEKQSLPSNHPSLAVTYHNTSQVLERLCRYQEAVRQQTRAVDILTMAYGPHHPDVQREENDLKRLREKL